MCSTSHKNSAPSWMACLNNSYIPFLFPSATPDIMTIFLARRKWKGEWGFMVGVITHRRHGSRMGRQLSQCTTVVKQRGYWWSDGCLFPLFYLLWEPQLLGWGHLHACLSHIFNQSSRISSHYPIGFVSPIKLIKSTITQMFSISASYVLLSVFPHLSNFLRF